MKTLNASQKFKSTPVGLIPVDWSVVSASTVCTLITKGTTPRIRGVVTVGTRVPFLRVQNLTFDGSLDFRRDQLFIESDTHLTELARSRVLPSDVLINIVGPPLGKVSLVPKEYPEWNINQAIAVFRAGHQILGQYLAYFLQIAEAQDWLVKHSKKTSGQQNLTLEVCRDLPICLPPIAEQTRIIEVLTSWDRAIEKMGALIAAKQKLKQGLMQQLLTGRRKFPTLGNSKTKNSNHWKKFHLGELFDERVEINRPDLPLLSITADRGVIPRDDLDKKDTSNNDKSKYRRIAPGDIGYNTMRMWQGVSAVSSLEGIISPAYTVCIPRTEKIDGQFAAHLLKFPAVVRNLWRHSQGLVDDTLNLKFNHFAQVRVSIPAVDEQRRIAVVLRVADNEIKLLAEKCNALREQKRGLMQKLLTGKVRIRI